MKLSNIYLSSILIFLVANFIYKLTLINILGLNLILNLLNLTFIKELS